MTTQIINNEIFEQAKSKYDLMTQRLCSMFGRGLDKDTRRQCGDKAIWRCLKSHDETRQHIKSSLYRFVNWECKRALQEQRRKKMVTVELVEVEYVDDTALVNMMLDEYLSVLSSRNRRMVEAKFLEGRTFREISKIEACSVQGAINIINRSVRIMSRMATTQ